MSLFGLRPNWSVSASRSPNGQNFGNYENPSFDSHLDSATTTTND